MIYVKAVEDYFDGEYELLNPDPDTTLQEINEFINDRYAGAGEPAPFEIEIETDDGWITGIRVAPKPSALFEDPTTREEVVPGWVDPTTRMAAVLRIIAVIASWFIVMAVLIAITILVAITDAEAGTNMEAACTGQTTPLSTQHRSNIL